MRKLFAFLMLAIFVSISFEGFAQTGPWSWSQPTPQGNTLRWVKYWDANNWYAVGYAGTFMKTTNAGTSWTWTHAAHGRFGTSGQNTNIYNAHFFNQSTGLTLGSANSTSGTNGIWRTTNGGTNWDTTNITPYVTGTFYFASFVNSTLGYACATSAPYVFRTIDGGMSWTGVTTAGGTAYDIHAFDSLNIIVASTSGNVRRSTDGGASWAAVSTGASATLYRIVFQDANTGYVSGSSSAFRVTTDAGLTWTTPANLGLAASTTFYDIDTKTSIISNAKLEQDFELSTFPPDGWSLVAATPVIWSRSALASGYGAGTGSTRAYFYGVQTGSQELISKTLTAPSVAGDSIKFDHAYATYSTENDNLDILTSTDDGATWTLLINLAGGVAGPLNTGGVVTTSFVPTSAQWATKWFALPVGTNKISFKGNTAYGNNLFLDNIIVVPAAPPTISGNVYLTGHSFYVYKTTNMGVSWDSLEFLAPVSSQPWTSTYYTTDMIPGNNDDFITGGAYGLFNKKSGSTNTVFTYLRKPGTHNDVWAASSTGTVIAVGSSTSTGSVFDQIVRSTDGGSTWEVASFPTTSRSSLNCINMIDNNTGWVCGTIGGVYKTTNAGLNWDSVAVEGSTNSVTFRKVDFINTNTGWLFATFSNTVTDSATMWKTTNAGVNWTKQYLLGVTGSSKGVYSADMVSATHGSLVNWDPDPYHTTDGGTTWILDTLSAAPGSYLYDIKMLTPTLGFAVGSSGRVYKTTNGTFWDTLSVPTRSYTNYGIDMISPSAGYIVGSSGTVFGTTDGGATWTQANTNGATMYNVFMTPDTKAFAVSSNGYIFKNNNILTGISGNQGAELPMKYTLEQNYPNPFNPTTTIKFALPKAGLVTLKIYDVAGREVMRLINNQNMNAGYQTQLFNGSMLSSGVYFYSLIVDNNLIGTKKMVLVK